MRTSVITAKITVKILILVVSDSLLTLYYSLRPKSIPTIDLVLNCIVYVTVLYNNIYFLFM